MKDFKWKVFSLDVWGNEEDGYEVNDRRQIGIVILPLEWTSQELLKALKSEGLIKYQTKDLKHISVEGDDWLVSIDYDGKPELQVERY